LVVNCDDFASGVPRKERQT